MRINHYRAAWLASLCAICSAGCVHFNHYSTFENKLPVPPEASVNVHVNDFTDFGDVSFWLWVTKSTNAPPFSLAFYADDASHRCTTLRIDECDVHYADGTVVRLLKEPLEIPFKPFGEESRVQYDLSDAIDRLEDFDLQIRGVRVFEEGTAVPFSESYKFEHQKVRGVLPGIVVWSGV